MVRTELIWQSGSLDSGSCLSLLTEVSCGLPVLAFPQCWTCTATFPVPAWGAVPSPCSSPLSISYRRQVSVWHYPPPAQRSLGRDTLSLWFFWYLKSQLPCVIWDSGLWKCMFSLSLWSLIACSFSRSPLLGHAGLLVPCLHSHFFVSPLSLHSDFSFNFSLSL